MPKRLALAGIFIFLTGVISWYIPRASFGMLLTCYSLLFGVFVVLYIDANDRESIIFLGAVGMVARVIALLSFPNLSDDIYRFFWDGYLLLHGYNPFSELPSELISRGAELSTYVKSSVYPFLNSQGYYSVYPPVSHAVYALGVALFPQSVHGAGIVMGTVLMASEFGILYFLYKLLPRAGIHIKHMLLYALNPLVILEACGNLHFEGLMIFFFLGAYWFLYRKYYLLFSLFFALSIMTKLITLVLYPLFFNRLGFKKFFGLGVIISLCIAVSFIPFMDQELISNFSDSLDLYMRKFEFNASIYYLLRHIGFQLTGYNEIAQIGPLLALSFVLLCLGVYLLQVLNDKSILYRALIILTGYLFLSTTVHPWYLISLIALSAFTNFKYPMVWSLLIYISYHTYQSVPYRENLWLVAAQYLALAIFLLVDTGILFPHIKRRYLA